MRLVLFASGLLMTLCVQAHDVVRATQAPIIDGDASDETWRQADWRKIDKPMIGEAPSAADFSGRYKLVWTPEYLFLLAEITDNVLIDSHANPLYQYWEDDTLEILIDEDASGGVHLEDFNAFAYHVALDNQVVDIAPANDDVKPRLFPGHVTSSWRRSSTSNNEIIWELRVAIHDDTHVYGDDISSRVTLHAGKKMRLMVAYCDADDAEGRHLFIGDVDVQAVNGDRNLAYIDASVFGEITLVDKKVETRGNAK